MNVIEENGSVVLFAENGNGLGEGAIQMLCGR